MRLTTAKIAFIAAATGGALGCSNAASQKHAVGAPAADESSLGPTGTAGSTETESTTPNAPGSAANPTMTNDQAFQFLTEECASCHGTGQSLDLTWPLPDPGNLTVANLAAMSSLPDVYQALVNSYSGAATGQEPTPMPPTLDATKKPTLALLIQWFQVNFPGAVQDARAIYGAAAQFSNVAIDLNYHCNKVSTARDFLSRYFNSAFGRGPSATELASLVPAAELDQPITSSRQSQLVALMSSDPYKSQFYSYGLELFAAQVSGAGTITSNSAFGLSDAAAADLQDEFYQLLLKYVDTKAYKDILQLPVVEVTANTAPLYNDTTAPCTTPAANTWAECQLSPKRSNFFGSIAYLNSAPSSFIASNNNYKRAGNLYGVLSGVILLAQTNGPKGIAPNPIPSCLTTQDSRMVANDPTNPAGAKSPRGALAVPRSGAICQGCHLYKYLDVASYVFRPFDQNGLAFTAAAFDVTAKSNPYMNLVNMASAQGIVNAPDPTTAGTQVTPRSCSSSGRRTIASGANASSARTGRSWGRRRPSVI